MTETWHLRAVYADDSTPNGTASTYGQVQYYVFLLFKGWANEQVTRIVSNVEPVIMFF